MPIGAFKLNSIAKYLAPTALRPKTITVNGNAQVSTAQSKFGGASALFDGSGDYLNTAVYSDLNSASSDVTWECWIYVNNVTGAKIVMGGRYDYEPLIYLSGSTLRLYLSSNGTSWNLVNGATFGTLAINTWYHIAFVRNGTTVKTYRDGVEQSSTAVSTTAIWWTSTPQLYIGCIDPTLSSAFWNGYIDEVRISSTARYTAAFTPTTSPFTSDANTIFLMHANGANASTTFTDDDVTWNNNNKYSNPMFISGTNIYQSTAQSKFGSASLFADSNNNAGQFWETVVTAGDFGSGNWTIEGFYRLGQTDSSGVYRCLIGSYAADTNSMAINLRSFGSGTYVIEYYWQGENWNGNANGASGLISANTWYHWAIVRDGANIYIYGNGTRNSNRATAKSNLFGTAGKVRVFGTAGGTFMSNSYQDSIRISNSARYTGATLTVPTAAFSTDANTKLLLNFNGANNSQITTDDA